MSVAPIGTIAMTACLGLFAARYFVPAESAALGGTLWIATAWFALGGATFAVRWRAVEAMRSPDGLDLGIALLVAGQIFAALRVLWGEGDQRAAINMMWEWLSLGVSLWLLRDVLAGPRGVRRVVMTICLCCLVLSMLGIWQYLVSNPGLASQMQELDQLTEPGVQRTVLDQQRIRELQADLGLQDLARDDPNVQLLRNRIAHSTEPIGRFALANTLAGLLVVGLLLSLGEVILGKVEPGDMRRRAVWLGVSAMIGLCLWLTKSRTSWIGLLMGLALWAVLAWRGRSVTRISRGALLAVMLMLGCLPLLAAIIGGLDREVISEAPKSLQYRLEYWVSTWGVVRDHWLAGVGPGNFRQHYLRYKLPGASEEVLDPHNWLLDLWANGGLLSLLGMGVVLLVTVRCLARINTAAALSDDHEPHQTQSSRGAMFLVGTLAMLTAGVVGLLGAEPWNGQLLALWGLWCVAAVMLPMQQISEAVVTPLAGASAAALLVHLTGSGGIAMPAIGQLLLVLMAMVHAPKCTSPVAFKSELPSWTTGLLSAALFLAFAGCLLTSALPVTLRDASMQIARAEVGQTGNLSAAEDAVGRAIESDPLAPDPWEQRAVISLLQWEQGGRSNNAMFDRAVESQQQAIRRDPVNPNRYRTLASLWLRHSTKSASRVDSELAANALQSALARYPQDAFLWADLADAAAGAGDQEQRVRAARRALELDDLNRGRQHWDRVIADERRERLQRLTNEGLEPSPSGGSD